MSKRYYPGPYWTINSSEAGVALLLAGIVLAVPAIPAGAVGWFIGLHMFGNNFAKWGFMLLFFGLVYLFIIYIKETKGLGYAVLAVFLEYLAWDYGCMIYYEKDTLIMQKILASLLEWGLKLS